MRRALSAAGVTALLLVLGLRSADAAVVQIKMAQVAYAPAQVTAHVGDTIEWINEDIVAHTATARSGAWEVTVQPKGKASETLKSSGTIEYFCSFTRTWSGRLWFLSSRHQHSGWLPALKVAHETERLWNAFSLLQCSWLASHHK